MHPHVYTVCGVMHGNQPALARSMQDSKFPSTPFVDGGGQAFDSGQHPNFSTTSALCAAKPHGQHPIPKAAAAVPGDACKHDSGIERGEREHQF